jgi:hypothetical protein
MNRPRYSNLEKRQAVLTLLTHPGWHNRSDREIAKHCGVSNRFVGNLRKKLALSVYGTQIQNITTTPERQQEQGLALEEPTVLSVYGTQIQRFTDTIEVRPTERLVRRGREIYCMNPAGIGKRRQNLDAPTSTEENQSD